MRRVEVGASAPQPEAPFMDQIEFVELLNGDLELEHQSIVQYIHHIATVKGAEYRSTLEELGVHVQQEVSTR